MPQQQKVVRMLRLLGERGERDHGRLTTVGELTAREQEVIRALAENLESEGVAERLGINVEEERSSVTSIFGKLGRVPGCRPSPSRRATVSSSSPTYARWSREFSTPVTDVGATRAQLV